MSSRRGPSLELTDELLKAVLVLARTVEQTVETRGVAPEDGPLSRSKIQLLHLLGQRGPQNSTQIARFLGVSNPAVTQLVAPLVRSRLLKRRPAKGDRRRHELELTPKGRQLFQRLRSEQRHLIRRAVTLRDSDDATRWSRKLKEITSALLEADKAFRHFCLQCDAHGDRSCVLVGGNARCPYLESRAAHAKRERSPQRISRKR